jgi:hypothetical protein
MGRGLSMADRDGTATALNAHLFCRQSPICLEMMIFMISFVPA